MSLAHAKMLWQAIQIIATPEQLASIEHQLDTYASGRDIEVPS